MSALCLSLAEHASPLRGIAAAAFDQGRVGALSLNMRYVVLTRWPASQPAYVISARHGARKCTSLGNRQAMSMANVGQHKRPGLEG